MRHCAILLRTRLSRSVPLALAVLLSITPNTFGQIAPQADVPPDTTPQIQQVTPAQAAPGGHVTVTIQGSGFSAGAYVSSVSAAVRVDASKRVSPTQLEAQITVSASAQPGTVSLLVSNPASRSAEAAFKIATQEPAQPAAPPAPLTPPAANPPAGPSAPAAPPVPAAPPSTPPVAAPAAPSGPVVTTVEPPQVGRGFDLDLKLTGKNFVQGTKVSFANPGIRVMSIISASATELTVHIKVAGDAAAGAGSLFVVNPDDSEVEVPFAVTAKGAAPVAAPVAAPASTTPTAPVAAAVERYEAYHLGSPAEIFQAHGRVKGALVVASGTLRYEEDGKTLLTIALTDVREIKTSAVATATFHVTLNSGKTFHFAPGSLRPGDARNLVDALRKELPH